jgi:hypothetical protein
MYIVYKEDPVVKACGKELGGCAAQWGYQRIYRVSKGNVWTQWDYDGTQWDYDGTQWDYDGTQWDLVWHHSSYTSQPHRHSKKI